MITLHDTATIYHRVIEVTSEYLGPAAPRFIDRQIEKHLRKSPDQLVRADLPKLIDWSKIAIALLTDDQRVVMHYVEDMSKLYHESK